MQLKKQITYAMLGAVLVFGTQCKKKTTDSVVPVEQAPVNTPKNTETTAERGEYYPYEVASLRMNNNLPGTGKVNGTIGDKPLEVTFTDSNMVFVLPDLVAGDYIVKASLNGKTVTATMKVKALATVADPDAKVKTYLSDINTRIVSLRSKSDSLPADRKAAVQADIAKLEKWATNLNNQYASLTTEQKQICAKTLAANQWWIDEIHNAVLELNAATVNARLEEDATDYEAKVMQKSHTYLQARVRFHKNADKIIVLLVSGGLVYAANPVGIIVGAGLAIGYLLPDLIVVIKAQDDLLETIFKPFLNMVADFKTSVSLRTEATTLAFENKIAKTVSTTVTYRTLYANDRSATGFTATLIGGFDAFVAVCGKLNSHLPEALKLPFAIDSKTAFKTQTRTIHPKYLTASNVTNSKVVLSKQDRGVNGLSLTFSTNETTKQDFSYSLEYKSDLGEFTTTVAASVAPTSETLTDLDGNTYRTTTIGTQTWMAENLKTTKYNDGTAITLVTSNDTWASNYANSTTIPMMSYYENSTANAATYGALYNWYVVNTGKLCPTGWHVPTDAEWTTLTTYLGGEAGAGLKLKSTSGWNVTNTSGLNGTNEVNFTALPGGVRDYYNGTFITLGAYGFWWSASADGTSFAWLRNMNYYNGNVDRSSNVRVNGLSVRCLRD